MNATTFTAFALSQLTNTSAGHAQELGDSLTPNVTRSDKGRTPQRRKASSPNAVQLSPSERTARMLAFRGATWNYGAAIDPQADAAKTERILGRTNEARTQ